MLPIDVIRIADAKAAEYEIPPATLAAIIDVESAGRVFHVVNGRQVPAILYEPHLLGRRITGAALAEALKAGLASKKWDKRLYGRTQADRWQQIADASKLLKRHGIDPSIAAECASYGVGQVLGSHWKSLGFKNFQAFYDMMLSGAEGQIEIMLRYCKVNDLIDELQDGRMVAFFRGYNGPAHAKNQYQQKFERAVALYGGSTAGPDGMLRMGSKGLRVRELQSLLTRAGIQVKVDGDFGPSTKAAVKAFQTANGLTVDGVVGPQTEAAIGEYRQGHAEQPGKQKPTEIKEVLEGLGGVGGAVVINEAKKAAEEAIPQLQQYEALSEWIGYGVTALTVLVSVLAVASVAYAAWGFIRSRRTKEA